MAEPTVLMHKAMVRVVVQETAKPRNQLLNDSTKRTEQLRELIKGLRNNIICLANEHQN
ncbi:26719_t:CDS:1, partial [Racocetra persica]